jgi:hypothetical protein
MPLRGFDGVPATVELIAFGHALNDGTELWLFYRFTRFTRAWRCSTVPMARGRGPGSVTEERHHCAGCLRWPPEAFTRDLSQSDYSKASQK